MSYDLDIFRGESEDDADESPPVDEDVVRAALAELPGVEEGSTELYWRVDPLIVTFMLLRNAADELTSVGVVVQTERSGSAQEYGDAYDRLLDFCLELTRRLEARLRDPQLDDYVTSENREESRASFAGA